MSRKAAKTDNHNPASKLLLRRAFLRRYHSGASIRVLDCFSGERELLWSTLRREFELADYLALDVKAKPGRIAMDSLRYLQNQEWEHDVIDLDAYGSPWKHWHEVLRRGRSATVFLTVGSVVMGRQDRQALRWMGVTFDVPIGLQKKLGSACRSYALTAGCDYGMRLVELTEAPNPNGSARYFGARIEPETS